MEKYSSENFFDGKISLLQPLKGYRYSMDPFVLCQQTPPPGPGDRILDIGCGCGIIPVLLGHCFPKSHFTGIEIQKELAEIALKNVINNNLEQTVSIIHQDIKTIDPKSAGGPFDLILSNPPYKKHNTGRLNPVPQKAIARHEIKIDIHTLLSKAETLLKHNGQLMIIFPAERLEDIQKAVHQTSIYPEWTQYIYTAQNTPPKRVLFSGRKNIRSQHKIRGPIHLWSTDITDMNITGQAH